MDRCDLDECGTASNPDSMALRTNFASSVRRCIIRNCPAIAYRAEAASVLENCIANDVGTGVRVLRQASVRECHLEFCTTCLECDGENRIQDNVPSRADTGVICNSSNNFFLRNHFNQIGVPFNGPINDNYFNASAIGALDMNTDPYVNFGAFT